MTRIHKLDELLSDRYHNYSLDDLTEKVCQRLEELYPDTNGVGRRQIEKDIRYLEYEGPFFVEIERYTVNSYNKEKQRSYRKRCLRYSNPSYSIFKKKLSDDEEYLLKEALLLLGQFDGLPNLDALEGLRLGLGARNDNRQIISFTKSPLENSNLLDELFTYISHKQVVKVCYHRFAAPDDIHSINVFPYLLKEYNHRWFLICQSEADGKTLCFSLDRIDEVQPLPSHDYVDYDGDINELFDDVIGVTLVCGATLYHIVFWVSDVSKDYVMTKPLHPSQVYIKGEASELLRQKYALQGGAFFSIGCIENYELLRELISFGRELIVLDPSELQNKIFEKIKIMFEDYQKLRT